jgi:Putative peptidoglycan binding domain
MKPVVLTLGVAVVATSLGCAPLSSPVTEREQTAAVGGLAGGAGGAIIGSMAGGAVAGGLFGIPIGALAGWYIGDYMANEDRIAQARLEERETELARLRRENEQLRRDEDRPARGAQLSSREQGQSSAQRSNVSEQNITSSRQTTSGSQQQLGQQGMAGSQQQSMNRAQVREVQKKLNDQGFNAGPVDGVLGPNTQAAIKNFQESKGLEATGQLNQQTMDALGMEATGRQKADRPAASDRSQTAGTGQTSTEAPKNQ